MSDFQSTLEEAMKEKPEPEVLASTVMKPAKFFSVKSFLLGLFICALFFMGLAVWAWLSADETRQTLVNKMPSKTAIVNTSVFAGEQMTITMKPDEAVPEMTAKMRAEIAAENKEPNPPPVVEDAIQLTEKTPKQAVKAEDYVAKTNKPLLSFVITDLGLSSKKTQNIIQNFDKEISLSFSPYASNLQASIDSAKQDGHEAFIMLPLETKNFPLNDAGPYTLMVSSSTSKNLGRLDQILKSAKNHDGFVAQKDHLFKAEDANVNPAIDKLFAAGHSVIDSNTEGKSFLRTLAERRNYPFARNTLWLDDDLTPLALNKNLRAISEYSQLDKNVIVMLRPYPASLKAVQKFLNSKVVQDFEIAPASAHFNK